ncbi:acyltransferase 3 [Actibacterium atlanticum]|uniref:Acyltransferase 3 n=1 Tax=Actibacterium atlanticum TaxID=1461693 RepID=A0A058ZJ37_9RHOB|nr:acyltransferase 3 [Actibacterium atlanticum]
MRFIAVVPVILFHAQVPFFTGGFVGVDVFFVISGFLITSILMNDLEKDRFSLVTFYERRARRILPALFAMIAACVVAAELILLPGEYQDFAESAGTAAVFLSNVFFWANSGYFDPISEESPLLHTWSLAVEEQYYLLFPLILWALWKAGPKTIVATLTAMTLASLALAEWGWRNEPTINFYFIGSRAFELFIGSLSAIWARRAPQTNGWLAGLGLAMIVAAIFGYSEEVPFPSIYALLPVVGTALVLLFARDGTQTARLLSLPLLVWVGLISYSAYLWHQPLLAFARVQEWVPLNALLTTALIAMTFALAFVSWKFVEQPFRSRGTDAKFSRRQIFIGSAVLIAVTFAYGLYGRASDGRLERWKLANPDIAREYALLHDGRENHKTRPDKSRPCTRNHRQFNAQTEEQILACYAQYGPAVAVLGDSIAEDLHGAMVAASERPFILGLTLGGCRLNRPVDKCSLDQILDFASRHPEVFEAVVTQQLSSPQMVWPSGSPVLVQDLRALAYDAEIPPLTLNTELVETGLDYAARLAAHVPVYFLAPRVEHHVPAAEVMRQGCDVSYKLRSGQMALFTQLDTYFQERIPQLGVDGLRYLPLSQMHIYDPATEIITCDVAYWRDGHHWSAKGEAYFGRRLIETGPYPFTWFAARGG